MSTPHEQFNAGQGFTTGHSEIRQGGDEKMPAATDAAREQEGT